LDELREQMQQDDRDIEEIRKSDHKKIDDVLDYSGYKGDDRIISSYEALDIIKEKHSNVKRFKSGFYKLDRMTL